MEWTMATNGCFTCTAPLCYIGNCWSWQNPGSIPQEPILLLNSTHVVTPEEHRFWDSISVFNLPANCFDELKLELEMKSCSGYHRREDTHMSLNESPLCGSGESRIAFSSPLVDWRVSSYRSKSFFKRKSLSDGANLTFGVIPRKPHLKSWKVIEKEEQSFMFVSKW